MDAEAVLAVSLKDRDRMQPNHKDLLGTPQRSPAASAVRGRGVAEEEGGAGAAAFGELKASVDRQMARMVARMEGARAALAALMRKVSGEASSTLIAGLREEEAGDEGDDGVKGMPGFHGGAARLLMELQEMVVDAGAVRDSVASSFDAMDEQQWLMDAGKETYGAVVQGFLRDINVASKHTSSSAEGCHLAALQQHPADGTRNSSEECDYRKDETRQLQSTRRKPAEKSDSSRHCDHSEEGRGISHQEAERLMQEKVDSEIRCELHDVLYPATFRDLARQLTVQADVHKLTEERDEVGIRSNLQDEIHSTIFKGMVKELADESADHLIRTSIKDEVQTVSVAKTLNAWKSRVEMVQHEILVKEEIDSVIFGGLTKDLLKSEGENRPRNGLGRFRMIENREKLQINPQDEGPDSYQQRVILEREISSNACSCVRQNFKEIDLQAETSSAENCVSGNVEEALEDQRMPQTREMARSLKNPPRETNQEMFVPLTNFQEMLRNFEADICKKIETATMRLRDLDKELASVSEQVSSLRRSELTYRRAFTGRCCDLQKAEAEVDLLGDEVELLVRLLRKTYRVLDHYSPVLQHYLGIKEMLCLLGEELPLWHHVQ